MRETGRTVAESLVAFYRVGTHQNRRGQREARSSTGQGVLNPCARASKVRTRRFLREKLISDYDRFSSYGVQQGVANEQNSWGFFRDAQGLGWLDAGSRVGFTNSRPPPPWTSVFQFSLFLYNVWA